MEPPDQLRQRFGDSNWEMVWSHVPQLQTWRISAGSGETMYLKLVATGWTPPAEDEVARLRWASSRLPAPAVIDFGQEPTFDWILTDGLPGRNAIDPKITNDPAQIAGALGRGVRRFHSSAFNSCPFDARNDVVLPTLRSHMGPSQYDALEALRPESEDVVVTHGDACLPNFLIEDWEVTGFVDLGDLGVADRWRDIAVALWSLDRNLGPGWGDTFLRAYGVERDERKLDFYGRLYHAS